VIDSAAAQKTAVAALHAGMSKDEVRNKLGEPRIRVTMDGGLERWTYYSYDAQGRIAAKTMIIFGDDGTIVEISDTSS
jgi:YD repeat-containing protein